MASRDGCLTIVFNSALRADLPGCYIRALRSGRSRPVVSFFSTRLKTMRYLILAVCVLATACAREMPGSPTSPTTAAVGSAQTEAKGGRSCRFRAPYRPLRLTLSRPRPCLVNGTESERLPISVASPLRSRRPSTWRQVRQPVGSPAFVAANGDHLDATFTGQGTPTSQPNIASIEETATITGGNRSIRRCYRRLYRPPHSQSGDGCVLRVV